MNKFIHIFDKQYFHWNRLLNQHVDHPSIFQQIFQEEYFHNNKYPWWYLFFNFKSFWLVCYWSTLSIYTHSIKHEGDAPTFITNNNVLLHNLLILHTIILVTKKKNVVLWKYSTSLWWPALHLGHTNIQYNISEIWYLHSCIKLIAQLNLNLIDNSYIVYVLFEWKQIYIYKNLAFAFGRLFISRQKQSFISLTKNVKHF